MFSKRKTLSGRTKFDKNFVISLKEIFLDAKLNNVTVKLPHNYLQEEEKNEVGIDEFINIGRNFPAIIVIAKNQKKKEEIKILFVNISTKSYFYDHTFPSGHSEPSEIFVSTPDPVRTWGLFEFFYNHLKKSGLKNKYDQLKLLGFFLSIVVIMAQFSALISTQKFFLNKLFGYNQLLDIATIIISMRLIYLYYDTTKGVYVNERPSGLSYFLIRILKGEFRDNPLVNFFVSIIASIVAALILNQFI